MSRSERVDLDKKYPENAESWNQYDGFEESKKSNSYFGNSNVVNASKYIADFFIDLEISILEVGAGNCWASRIIYYCLKQNPKRFIATDLFDCGDAMEKVDYIEFYDKLSSDQAVKKFGSEVNTLLLVSPPPNNPMDFYAIREWSKLDGKRYIIYLGELGASDGCDGMYLYMMEHPKYELVLGRMIEEKKDIFGGACEKELFIFEN
jgi:hypothetical protein